MSVIINAAMTDTLHIGKQAENEAIRVDFTGYYDFCVKTYGAGGSLTLLHQRQGDAGAYPRQLTFEDGRVYWDVLEEDLQKPGRGRAELTYRLDPVVNKSRSWATLTDKSMSQSANPPSPWQSYVDKVMQDADRAEDAREDAREAADSIQNMTVTAQYGTDAAVEKIPGNPLELHFTLPRGEKGDTGAAGADGYSPSAIVQRTEDGARITIVDEKGITTAEVRDGRDGKDGKDGKDGENAPVTTIASFEMDENGVLYCETVTESAIQFEMINGILEVNY